MRARLLALLILPAALAWGLPADVPPVVTTPAADPVPAATVVESARAAVASTVSPALRLAREAVPATVPPPASAPPSLGVSPAAVDHIVRWEVTSPAYYTNRLQRPIWPGGASGITWGIGYDGGHQSAARIAADWPAHPHVQRLARTAGITGAAAKGALPAYRDIVTPYPLAADVFENVSLPAWLRATERAYGPALYNVPPDARGALVGNTYNRGASMVGSRNAEKRTIRDRCLPAGDVACLAAQLRAQCRLWRNTNLEAGLCGRRDSEARLAEGAR